MKDDMDSSRKTAKIVGVLFVTALASSMLSGTFSASLDDPDYLTAVSANGNQVLIGVLFQLVLTASVVAIPIMMYPILNNYNKSLSIGYVCARIFEGFFDALIAISMLLLLALSLGFVKAGAADDSSFQTSGTLLLAARDWSSIVENFPYGIGALIFYYSLYRYALVPRWLAGWGLVGGALMLAMGLLRMFGQPAIFLAIPIIINELVLAIWLISKGFSSSAVVSDPTTTGKN